MHTRILLTPFLLAISLAVGSASTSTSTGPQTIDLASAPCPNTRPCDPRARGPDLPQRQQEATAHFATTLLQQHNVQAAFDQYAPGEYIQHNPNAELGRNWTITFLQALFSDPAASTTNLRVFTGQGYGLAHYKLKLTGRTLAVMDVWRFEGTCVVEHWDVIQGITGNEPNPIAFF
ncbi:hypothetical protein FA15DRAFT_717854 [Coprinopsis marcescibilis]|uniref:SnoaL-like domain-containing protein n=1 Tax=Coprinopsis marcescibilis TaxID=230819 RepID=A0A5C3KME1_COPMA|nr:hypothetical protein FA15DRAFT_717854 [Coprinopsis marcescibilis]